MLAMAEYAYHNSRHLATKISPFYANYAYEPQTNLPNDIQFRNQASETYGHYMTGVDMRLTAQLEMVRVSMAKYYN
jgi:hypothetical protein